MSNAKIARLIKNTDNLIGSFESRTIRAVESAMDASFRQLEREFRRKWLSLESQDLAGKDRAILLINEIRQYMQLLPSDSTVEGLYQDLMKDCQIAGITIGSNSLSEIQGFSASTVNPNLSAIAFQSRDAAARLSRHSQDFQLRASAVIQQGLVGGSGVAKVAEMLRRELGVTKAKAETIARTESMSAMDSASRDTYKANGIEYVQRIGTQDDRICPYCAARVGNVYPVDKAPAIIHPRDRCYNMPFSPAWIDLGLVDMDWLQSHRAASIASMGDKAPNYGPSPFEQMAGQRSPAPTWTITKGFNS
jgi:SPP1 gp7 family putative phage head morphogenesis protein